MSARSRLRVHAVLVALAVVTLWGRVVRAQSMVIPRGQEPVIVRMVSVPAARAGGCHSGNIGVERSEIRTTFVCPGRAEPLQVTLRHVSAPGPFAFTTARFGVSAQGMFPPALEAALQTQIAQNEGTFQWAEVVPPPTAPAGGAAPSVGEGTHADESAPSTRADCQLDFENNDDVTLLDRRLSGTTRCVRLRAWPGVALCAALWLAVLLLAVRYRTRLPPRATPHGPRPYLALAVLVLAVHVAQTIHDGVHAHFLLDDYSSLLRAKISPWQLDYGGRWLSVSVLFRMGVLLGAHPLFFGAANVIAHLAGVAAWYWMARSLGAWRDEALLSAGLLVLSPGQSDLIQWPIGFQQLLAHAFLFVSLGTLFRIFAAPERPRGATRAYTDFLLAGLTSLAVMTKPPVAGLIPASIALSTLFAVAGHAGARRERAMAGARAMMVTTLSFMTTMLLVHPFSRSYGDASKAGFERLADNAGSFVQALVPPFRVLALPLVAALVLGLGIFVGPWRRAFRRYSALGTSLCRRSARLSWAPLLIGLAIVWALPFLLNRTYFATYYARLSFAPLSLLVASVVLRVPRRSTLATAVLAAALAFSLYGGLVRPPAPPSPWRLGDRADWWLAELQRTVAGQPQPLRLALRAECPDPSLNARSRAELQHWFVLTEQGEGIQWATGWYRTRVFIEEPGANTPAEGTLRLLLCADRPLRLGPTGQD